MRIFTALVRRTRAGQIKPLFLEYIPDDEAPRRDLVDEAITIVDGYLRLPERPGLGIDLNEEALGLIHSAVGADRSRCVRTAAWFQ
jgi:L-alanine-DL-glutamate epimerase-like enolase superfamily enzyme